MYENASKSKAWVFEEAKKILVRAEKIGQKDILFETGYGPSGLPHIGTFGEVARTNMVRHALHVLAPKVKTRLICFSDDLDGLRKVPENIPNADMLETYLEQPLTSVPDPFGTHESFGAHNNSLLCHFLDQFGFEYEFASATEYYRSGRMDDTLLKIFANLEKVTNIILPTLGQERQKTYSPFLPICPQSGKVLMVAVKVHDVKDGTISYVHPHTHEEVITKVTGGACKLQWKADWAMRWVALNVDYEMAGKDLIESVKLSSKICKAIGGVPPVGLSYELFLDENGEKISKSRGNGVSIEEWLHYASPESLSLYMYQSPRKAKRLHFGVIPKVVDEYQRFLEQYFTQDETEQLNNPVWHIYKGNVPEFKEGKLSISFSLLLNLVSASHAENKDVLWGFIHSYAENLSPETHPYLDQLSEYAVRYFHDFVKPHKSYRLPTEQEIEAFNILQQTLENMSGQEDAKTIQNKIYEIGEIYFEDSLKLWFQALYEVLLGQSQGPRFGSFVALYGIDKTILLIEKAFAGEFCEEK